MKIYEVSCSNGREWFDKKAAAQRARAAYRWQSPSGEEAQFVTWDIENTRANIVHLLNQVAARGINPDAPPPRTVVRVTASKPPVPDPDAEPPEEVLSKILEIIQELDDLPNDHEPDTGDLWEGIRRIERVFRGWLETDD